jgi:hypothetical protein
MKKMKSNSKKNQSENNRIQENLKKQYQAMANDGNVNFLGVRAEIKS